MWLKPGGRALRFRAVEELEARRVAFSWRARFPFGLRVVDGYDGKDGRLDVRLLGLPVQRQRGQEITEGEILRYLAELPWVPPAKELNNELEWRNVDERTVEVAAKGLTVRLDLDSNGDVVRASSALRRYQGEPTPWAGEYSAYQTLGGMRLPTAAAVSWELETGRYVYWAGRVTSAEAL
jgi:Family of unknown function (DUF6544)